MSLSRPTLSEIYDRMISDVETRFTEIGALLRRSLVRILIKVFSGAVHLLYGFVVYTSDQIFASTATGDNLATIGSEYGLYRNTATTATATCEITGTNGVIIPADTELQSANGFTYTVDEAATIAAGTATVTITAKVAGSDSNDEGGITLTFVSPIAGADSTATVDSDGVSGGADDEDDEDYRNRILFRKRYPPQGGCQNDYIQWAKETSGVTRAWCFPSYSGLGTVGIAFVRDNDTSILPNSTQRDAMLEYITEHTDPSTGQTVGVPITATNGVSVIELTELDVDLTISLYPNTATIQAAVESELAASLLVEGGPAETVRLSKLSEAVGNATGELYHAIILPIADITASYTQVHVLGTVTFQDYT